MRLNEIEHVLQKVHYFRVPPSEFDIAKQVGLQQDREGRWCILQYNTSGKPFNMKMITARRMFGAPNSRDA